MQFHFLLNWKIDPLFPLLCSLPFSLTDILKNEGVTIAAVLKLKEIKINFN